SRVERACGVAERAGVVGDGSQVALRPQPSVEQLLRRHRSFVPGWRVIVLSNSRLRAKTKARVAGAARALGSHEIVEDQDVTATSATRPKSRVATRASVQQHSVAGCIRTAGVCRSRQRVSRSALQPPTLVARLPAVRQLPGFPLALLLTCLLVAACGHEDRKPVVPAPPPRVSPRSVRITLDALHHPR